MWVVRLVAALAISLSMWWPDPSLGGSSQAAASAPTSERAPPSYRAPSRGPVVDPFRPPETDFGSGNLGWEYQTAEGESVVASGSGEVLFAGQVGGSLHVTVGHADGLRTSYSFLSGFAVRVGATVGAGDVLGWSAGSFHFGVRNGDDYIDPASLFDEELEELRLLPVDEWAHDALQRARERSSLMGFVSTARRGVGTLVSSPASALSVGVALMDPLIMPMAHYSVELIPAVRAARAIREYRDWHRRQADCTSAAVAPVAPAERRVAVLVAGFRSSSGKGAVEEIEVAALGYEQQDVLRFSYRGGRVPTDVTLSAGLEAIEERSYEAQDTIGDLEASSRRLAELLQEVARANPGVPVDVLAHSQGGVVAHLAVSDPWSSPPGEVDLVATMGSPHEGTDIATAAAALERTPAGRGVLRVVGAVWDPGVLDQPKSSVLDMAETSRLSRSAQRDFPDSIRLLTLGAQADWTVPAGHTRLDGVDHRTLAVTSPTAHTDLPGSAGVTRELALALAGQSPTCESWIDGLHDAVVPEAISYGEDLVGAAVAGATHVAPVPPD